ncbi:MAG: lipocalin-like domain-containing protein [bacterium]|nr:MAG: lipocalin-like domain-containing protein [bacterium]
MMKSAGILFISIFLVIVVWGCSMESIRESLEGVWEIKGISTVNGSISLPNRPIPSIFIFTQRHYSMVWVLSDNPDPFFSERWNPTDKEKIERYNSLVVNSGTYKLLGSHLTAFPVVARVPEFMGGRLVCEYKVEEDTLRLKLIDEYSYDNVQAPWVASGNGLILTLARIDQFVE